MYRTHILNTLLLLLLLLLSSSEYDGADVKCSNVLTYALSGATTKNYEDTRVTRSIEKQYHGKLASALFKSFAPNVNKSRILKIMRKIMANKRE